MNKTFKSLSVLLFAASLMLGAFSGCARPKEVIEEYWVDGDNSSVSAAASGAGSQGSGPDEQNSNTKSGKDSNNSTGAGASLAPAEKGDKLGGATITIAGWGDGRAPKANSRTYKQETELIKEIEKKYDCKISWVAEYDPVKYTSAFNTAAMAGTKYADIVYLPSDAGFPAPVLRGYFHALDSYVDLKLPQWNQKATNEIMPVKSKHYLLAPTADSSSLSGAGVFFNKALFKKFSIKTPYEHIDGNSWNWDNFRQAAKSLTRTDGGVQYYGIGNLEPTLYIQSNGVLPTKMSGGKAVFNLDNAQTVEALQFVNTLYHDDGVIAKTDGANHWKNGAAAMWMAAWYRGKEYLESLGDGNVGYAYLPIGKSAKDYYSPGKSANVVGIPVTVKNPKVVAKILTDYTALYKWRGTIKQSLEPHFGDAKALDIAVDQANRAALDMQFQSVYPYFTWEVLWKDFGIRDKVSPQAYIASIKQASIVDINTLWAN